jgi:hypothetical protein
MAITSYITCDLNHEEPMKAVTHTFSIDNRSYEIDLCENHLAQFQAALSEYVKAARRNNPTRGVSTGRVRNRNVPVPTPPVSAIREWARKNGMDVSTKGRIPQSLLVAYEASGSNIAEVAEVRSGRAERTNPANTVRREQVINVKAATSSEKRVVNAKGKTGTPTATNTRGRVRES